MNKKTRALLLLSGGLDSTLVAAILKRENIDILAIRFVTGLEYSVIKSELMELHQDDPALKVSKALDIPLRFVSLKETYLNMFLNPKYGYGSAINPCLDCHILMLKTAKQIMEDEGFDFIATGEVKGQRPMSQKAIDLTHAEKDSGLLGYLLRPLSAKCLPETIPEKLGLINREHLYAIEGRSRHLQMQLATELGIVDYPSPSGAGCSIVDKAYARRYSELIKHQGTDILTMEILRFLAVGRHIRLSDNAKLIVGRNESENTAIENRQDMLGYLLKPKYRKGPSAFIEVYKEIEFERIDYAAKIIASLSKEDIGIFEIAVEGINQTYKNEISVSKREEANVIFEQIL